MLALCGDIVVADAQGEQRIRDIFEFLSRQAKHLLFVPGNHEYWGTKARPGKKGRTERILRGCIDRLPNVRSDEITKWLRLPGCAFFAAQCGSPNTR